MTVDAYEWGIRDEVESLAACVASGFDFGVFLKNRPGWRVEEPDSLGIATLYPPQPIAREAAWNAAHDIAKIDGVAWAEPDLDGWMPLGDLAPPGVQKSAVGESTERFGEPSLDWATTQVKAEVAWKRGRGKDIVIGHPDSGFMRHADIGDWLLAPGIDLVDGANAEDDIHGGHGLGTASVLAARNGRVTGTAPEAEVFPIRVAKRNLGVPAPVLFWAGAKRLRQALARVAAAARGEDVGIPKCQVVSISLGWLGGRGLREAVKACVDANVIVVAAAGNYTPFIVWPGAYSDVVCCAACNCSGVAWQFSARGNAVDITAPGEGVFKAAPGNLVEAGNGTSFSAATVAGIAACWISYHGYENLLARYEGKRTLADVFVELLRATAQPGPKRPTGEQARGFGAGIADAGELLAAKLPDVLDKSSNGVVANDGDALDRLAACTVHKPNVLRSRLAQALDIPLEGVDGVIEENEGELIGELLGRPGLRHVLAPGQMPNLQLKRVGHGAKVRPIFGSMQLRTALECAGNGGDPKVPN